MHRGTNLKLNGKLRQLCPVPLDTSLSLQAGVQPKSCRLGLENCTHWMVFMTVGLEVTMEGRVYVFKGILGKGNLKGEEEKEKKRVTRKSLSNQWLSVLQSLGNETAANRQD